MSIIVLPYNNAKCTIEIDYYYLIHKSYTFPNVWVIK